MRKNVIQFKNSIRYAIKGIVLVMRREQNFLIQNSIAFLVVIAGVFFEITRIEWILLILAIVVVLTLEMVNSASERVVDIIKPRAHDLIAEIKDIIAGAVLIASVGAAIIGIILFLPYII